MVSQPRLDYQLAFTALEYYPLNMLLNIQDYLIVAVSILVIAIYYVSQKRPKGYPPGPARLPFIGNFHQLTLRPFIKFMEMQRKYGPVFAIDFASFRGVVINDHRLIREALSMRELSGRPKLKPFLDRNRGKFRGLLMNEGPSWLEHRRFTLRTLRDFGLGRKSMETIIQDEISELVSTLGKLNGKPLEITYTFNLTSLNSLWWIMTGSRFERDDKRVQEIIKLFTDILADSPTASAIFFLPWVATIAPKLSGYKRLLDMQMACLDMIQDLYNQQKATFVSGQHRHFLDLYIQEVHDCKDPTSSFYGAEGEHNLVGSITDLFAAGIETVSTTMVWSMLLLSLNPDVQDKLFEEIKSVTSLRRFATLTDEPSMPYTKAVITEVLRFSTIIPLNVFHSSVEDVEFHGYRIPKGTMIMPNLYAVHHDPEVWGDPDNFRPERFLTPEGQFSTAYDHKIMPFSVGRRVCIGEALARNTLFLMYANIFQNFKVLPNPAKPKPVIDYKPAIVLHPMPYEYVFHSRSNC